MNASLKLGDGRSPLLKVKLPVTLLGLPLASRLTAGNDEDLAFRLRTAFTAGPAFEISYRPNDGTRLLSLALRIGACQWGSPAGAMVSMSAEFSLLDRSRGPVFRLCVKPQAGDVSLRKDFASLPFHSTMRLHERATTDEEDATPRQQRICSSPSPRKVSLVDNIKGASPSSSSSSSSFLRDALHVRVDYDWENIEGTDTRTFAIAESLPQYDRVEEDTSLPTQTYGAKEASLCSFLATTRLCTYTSLRIRKNALLQIRWRANIPSDMSYKFTGLTSLSQFGKSLLPLFLVDKIRVARVAESLNAPHQEASEPGSKLAHLQALCLSTRNSLYSVQRENEALRKDIEDIRKDLGSRNITLSADMSSLEFPLGDEELIKSGTA